jgi:ligand-binding SRPBCC domain-containing protein
MESTSGGKEDQVFTVSQILPLPRKDVFAFFANPANLEKITPPWLRFRMTGTESQVVKEGSEFTYDLRVHGLPMRWRSLITQWVPGQRFVDVQLQGPYARWQHLHTFEDAEGGSATRVTDRVAYRLPFGPMGQLLAGWFVRSDLRRIFNYRSECTSRILEGY